MLTRSATQAAQPDWHSRELEAQLLADLLRLSRVTVLYGPQGAGKTTLLTSGVLPRLCRRRQDFAPEIRGGARVVVPFPDRRRSTGAAFARGEVAVFFDAWDADPVAGLLERLLGALPPVARHADVPARSLSASLAAWHDELDLRFFIVLDRFEDYLAASECDPPCLAFAGELARILNDSLPVNVLIALREDAQPMLEEFRIRVPGFDDAAFRLPALPDAVVGRTNGIEALASVLQETDRAAATAAPATTQAAAAPVLALATATESDQADTTAGERDDWARPVQQGASPRAQRPGESLPPMLPVAGGAGRNAAPQADAAHPGAAPTIAAGPIAAADPTGPDAAPAAVPPPVTHGRRSGRTRPGGARHDARRWLAAAAVVLAALPLAIWALTQQDAGNLALRLDAGSAASVSVPTMPVPTAPVPSQPDVMPTAPPAPALPQLHVLTEAGNSSDAVIAADLARAIGAEAGVELVVHSDGELWRSDAPPRLALVRYEVLEARRAQAAESGRPPESLRVVAPLYTEEIHFIVRRDSPLQYIHEIRDATVSVGPSQGARGVTVERLYRGMYGAPMPADRLRHYDDEKALARLLDGSLDVMMVVAAQPARWLVDLPPAAARSIRLLTLDTAHPLTQSAIQLYLPAVVLASSYRSWLAEDTGTLATMSFLVTTSEADPLFVERVETVARALCRNLPELRRVGHPKWREVEPAFDIDVGWPYSGRARAAYQSCLPEPVAGATVVRSR